MKFKINPKLFERYPSLLEAVVILKNIDNTVDGSEILKLLRAEEKKKAKEFSTMKLSDHKTISAWRNAFRDFGSKPNKFSSSVEALLKRVAAGNELPDTNPLVNLYNYCSIKHILPFGGEDFAGVYGDMELKYCEGTEEYIPIMGKENEPPDKGEIAWVDASGITCRKWNWRQCDRTKITENSKEGYFIIDGLPVTTREQVKEAAEDFIALAEKYLGAKGEICWLDKENPEAEIDIETKAYRGQLTAKQKTEKQKMRGNQQVKLSPEQLKDAQRLKKTSSAPKLDEVNFSLIKNQIQKIVYEAVQKAGYKNIKEDDVRIEHPADENFGDYSTNVAMILAGKLKEDLQKIADEIVKCILCGDLIHQTQIKGGFINIDLSQKLLVETLDRILEEGDAYGKLSQEKPVKLIVEFGQPNTHKMPHIGHLFSFIIGES
ncbi:hypothetical protein KJ918_00315, partial [Patescibacteria group bacterium]|nr:hypothetical protein [Patescibacteria group bacterium]